MKGAPTFAAASGPVLPDPAQAGAAQIHPPITELVAEAIDARPHATLLEQGERRWTNDEFAARADDVAVALQVAGHPPAEVVALIASHRGFDLYAALYAAWLVRAVPMIVDTGLSIERQQLMLERSGAQTVVTLDGHESQSPCETTRTPSAVAVRPDEAPYVLRSRGRRRSERSVPAPDDPAYVFFTSGSTGTPKGFVGRHNGLSHMLVWQRETFAIDEHDRCAQIISLRADASLRDIFTPVISGARLCLPNDPRVLGPEASLPLVWMRDAAVTVAHSVPTLALTWLADIREPVQLDELRLLFFSGEALSGHLANGLLAVAPNLELINLYGVSECTMFQTYRRLTRAQPGVQSVGVGVEGAQALVLTPSGSPCEIDQPGEIVLRTPYATLGYLNDVHNRAFVPNPFDAHPDERVFRTGDEGRHLPSGDLAVHGRIKHRPPGGFPAIAAEDVSAVLDQHPAVHLSAVLVTNDDRGRTCYDAYIVPAARLPSATELHALLRGHFREELAPVTFYRVALLPLTATGKLDRNQLRAGKQGRFPIT